MDVEQILTILAPVRGKKKRKHLDIANIGSSSSTVDQQTIVRNLDTAVHACPSASVSGDLVPIYLYGPRLSSMLWTRSDLQTTIVSSKYGTIIFDDYLKSTERALTQLRAELDTQSPTANAFARVPDVNYTPKKIAKTKRNAILGA